MSGQTIYCRQVAQHGEGEIGSAGGLREGEMERQGASPKLSGRTPFSFRSVGQGYLQAWSDAPGHVGRSTDAMLSELRLDCGGVYGLLRRG